MHQVFFFLVRALRFGAAGSTAPTDALRNASTSAMSRGRPAASFAVIKSAREMKCAVRPDSGSTISVERFFQAVANDTPLI